MKAERKWYIRVRRAGTFVGLGRTRKGNAAERARKRRNRELRKV